jgi:hypothetical protein
LRSLLTNTADTNHWERQEIKRVVVYTD